MAHTYCVPGEVLAVARHSGALTHKHVAQRLRAHPLLGDALFAGIAPGANDAATLLEHCERLSASANAPAGAVSAGRSEYGSGSAGHNKDK